jgi:hypothetical protein
LNDLRYISSVARKQTDLLAEDIDEFREDIKSKGVFAGLYSLISGLFGGSDERSKAVKTKKSKKQ